MFRLRAYLDYVSGLVYKSQSLDSGAQEPQQITAWRYRLVEKVTYTTHNARMRPRTLPPNTFQPFSPKFSSLGAYATLISLKSFGSGFKGRGSVCFKALGEDCIHLEQDMFPRIFSCLTLKFLSFSLQLTLGV